MLGCDTMELYVLDLETTTDVKRANKTRKELLFEEEATFMCAAMYAPVSKEKPIVKEYYGKDNAENAILDLPEGRFYTWNGARYDIHYIYHLLRKAGYSKQEQESTRKNESRKKQLKLYEFSYLLAGTRFISLAFRNHNGTVEIRDACLLFTCSLKKFIENTCPEYPKLEGTYNYDTYRIKESDFSESDKEYCRYDIYGFSVGLYRIREEFEQEFDMDILDSFTAGSFAMKYGKRQLTKDIEDKKEKEERLKELFPKVAFDRKFVIGGRTYVNPIHAGKVLENLTKVDANSFYPSIMVLSKLPYGRMKKVPMKSIELQRFLKNNPNKYVFAHLISGICRYNDMFSPIVTSDDLNNRDFPTVAGSADGVYLDDNILRDSKFEHKGVFMCYIFESAVGIMDYMAKVFEMKNRYKKLEKFALELAVKIILNSTYGKFIQRTKVMEYDFFDGIIEATGRTTELNGWYQYAPMGAAITANCRYELCRYMNILGDRFVYCDTDSLVFTGETPKEIPTGLELGEWKVEACPEGIYNAKKGKHVDKTGKGIFFQRKTYAMEIDGITKITFCGISSNAVKSKFPKSLKDIDEYKFLNDVELSEIEHDAMNKYELFPNGVPIERLQREMKAGIVFNVLQGNHTKNGVVLVERGRMKKYVERY
jgi:hypothetical protein